MATSDFSPPPLERDLPSEISRLRASRSEGAQPGDYNFVTKLGGRFTLVYPLFIGALLLLVYYLKR